MEEMMFNSHERELPPMHFSSVNYEELLQEPYIPEPVLKPGFPTESMPFGLSQAEPSHAELSTSTMAFTELPARMSFITLMGLEDSRESVDSAMKKLALAFCFMSQQAKLWHHRLKR